MANERKKNVRELATQILRQVDVQKAYADQLLDRALTTPSLNQPDRALLTELVYGTLRWRSAIDARLSPYLRLPLSKVDPVIRNLLRLAFYQFLFLDKVPDYAVVNEAVSLARSRGGAKAAGFTNAVLRNFLRRKDDGSNFASKNDSVAELAINYAHPEWLVARWLTEFGLESTKALLEANNQRAPIILRTNSLKITRAELLQRLRNVGIEAQASERAPEAIRVVESGAVKHFPGFADGLFQVQGEASQLVGYLLAPSPGERILDACAAPGGKTTHIAELMKDRGELVAIDNSARGVDRIRENAARLGVSSVRALRADASEPLTGPADGFYNRILVDAPCSGFGTLRGHPEIKWQRNQQDVQRLSRLQSKILQRVATHLKPGGILVYATCTLMSEENERVIHDFLGQHSSFELEDAAGYLPEEARQMMRQKFFFALPQRDDTDGFFAARMRKVL